MRFTYEESGDGFFASLSYIEQRVKPPPVTPPVTELEMRILDLLREEPKSSSTDLAEALSIGRDTVKEYLGRLKKKGLLLRKDLHVQDSGPCYWERRTILQGNVGETVGQSVGENVGETPETA